MGILSDAPAGEVGRGGEGAKFIVLFDRLDEDDQAMVRRWVETGVTPSEIARRLQRAGLSIGRSTIERGIPKLRARWAS